MRAHMTLGVFGALPVAVDGRRSADQLRAFGIAVSIRCGFLFLFGHRWVSFGSRGCFARRGYARNNQTEMKKSEPEVAQGSAHSGNLCLLHDGTLAKAH
jgi:hypothetical protein